MDISIDELPPSLGKEYFFTLNSLCWCCQAHVPGIQVAIKPLSSTDSRRLCGWTGSSWLSSDWKKKNARGRSRWPRNNADTVCHDVIRKTKAHLQLSLMWDEKGYYKLPAAKGRSGIMWACCWMRAGTLVPSDAEKIMAVNASTSVFAGQTSLQEYQDSWKVWKKENLPLLERELIESNI